MCARACMCVFVRVCIWGMCFHTEDIPRRALSIHQHSVCPLTDPDTHTPHGCVCERVNDCACYIVLAWMCTIDHASETVTAYVCMWNVMCKYVCVCNVCVLKRDRAFCSGGLLTINLIATRGHTEQKLSQSPSTASVHAHARVRTHTQSGPDCGGCVILAAWWDSLWCGSVGTLKPAGELELTTNPGFDYAATNTSLYLTVKKEE